MATLRYMFVCLCNFFLVYSQFQSEILNKSYDSEIAAVLNYLNSQSYKVYNYQRANLLNAHQKADITELSLDVHVDCINNYPDVPCTEKVLTCGAFVQTIEGTSQVLNDVNCKPKPEIIVEDVLYNDNPTEIEVNETKSIALSNEAVSSEVGEPFVAVRKDMIPCVGCPFDLDVNADGVEELINIALEHVGSERDRKQTLVKVLRLQQQVINGITYYLVVEIAPTICAKVPSQESCPRDSSFESSICQIVFLQKPWISKTKYVINNNCTQSQEYVTPKRSDLSNEIDSNDYKRRNSPNFDEMASSGTIEQMTPLRLGDLESQILVESDFVPGTPTEVESTEVNPTTVLEEEIEEIEGNKNDASEDTSIEERMERSAESSESEERNSTISELKQASNSSKESIESEERVGNATVKNSSQSTNSSEENSSEEKPRVKRAIPQLEKISPEEKGLVRDLADFAAAALDSIDDDNHRRIILQILGAKKMVGDDGVYYHLIMRMGISRCLEDKAPNPYENCREKLIENYTKICKVQVYVSEDFPTPKIVKSQCQNIKKDNDSNRTNYSRFRRASRKEHVVGGQSETDKDSENIKELLRLGLNHLNSQSSKNNKYKPVEVISATSQVVAGVLFRIKVKLSETDCSKTDKKDLEDCHVTEGTPTICEVKVWEKSWENFRRFTVTCENGENINVETTIRGKRSIPGGEAFRAKRDVGSHRQVYGDDDFVEKYIESGLKQLDEESLYDNKFKVEEIMSVTKQTVAGHVYHITAKVVLSNCKKGEIEERKMCGTLEGAEPQICKFRVFEALWRQNSRTINVTCDNEEYTFLTQHRGLLGNDNRTVQWSLFTDFLTKYNKEYSNKEEYKYRFKVFTDNLLRIRLLNTYEQATAWYGVTKFADLTQEEFSKSLGLRTDLRNENEPPFAQAEIPKMELPTEFDWRQKGAVTEVKDQGQCGSCWAFSVTGNVEGQYAIKNGKLLEFSEQELVDCDTEDQGCNGGYMDTAYRQIEKLGGLETEQEYPYDAEDEKCHFKKNLVKVQLTGALNISHNETDMAKWLVANGPISIGINANAMQFYMGGVSHPLKFLCSPKSLDHGVLIVGYGVHTYPLFNKTLPYWIVKNSWGKSWGEQGYYRVYRGDGTCGLNQTPSSAIVA